MKNIKLHNFVQNSITREALFNKRYNDFKIRETIFLE